MKDNTAACLESAGLHDADLAESMSAYMIASRSDNTAKSIFLVLKNGSPFVLSPALIQYPLSPFMWLYT